MLINRYSHFETELGTMVAAASEQKLVGLYFLDHVNPFKLGKLGEQVPSGEDYFLVEVSKQVEEFFTGKRKIFGLPIHPNGTNFQQEVWKAVSRVPYGETVTYLDLALILGNKNLVRAVGGAVGNNPISIIVPCHRVIGHDGNLVGYSGGLENKKFLLDLEHSFKF